MKNIKWWWIGGIAGMVVLLVLLILSRSQYSGLQADLDDTEAENSSLTGQLSSVQSNFSQTQSSLSSLQSDYDSLQNSYNSVSSQLTDIQAIFPPGEFASSEELQQWLNGNTISNLPPVQSYEEWYSLGLQLQWDAFNDGYIISVDIDYYDTDIGVWCVTVVDGFMWVWDPATDEIFQDTSVGPIN